MFIPIVFCFWQFAADPVRASEQVQLQAQARTAAFEQRSVNDAKVQRQEFEKRFNNLIDAIKNFSEAYNHSSGSVWPSDRARALQKAMEKLENSGQFGKAKN